MKNHTVTILGKSYKVEFLDDTGMGGMMGTAKASAQVIRIGTDQAKEHLIETLLHEMIHVVEVELGLGLTEQQVQCLAVGLFSCSNIEVKT